VNRYIKHLIALGCLLATILPLFAKQPSADGNLKKKAQYIFLEAMSRNAEDKNDEAFDLLKMAHETDPDNPVIAYYYGFLHLSLDRPSDDELENGLSLMRTNTVERPDDFYENYIYAAICSSLGEHDETIRVIETLIDRYPEKIHIYPVLSKSYAAKGKYAKAIAVVDSLEKTEGRSMSTTIMKIDYMIGANDTVAAIEAGKKFLGDAPDSVEPNSLMGNLYSLIGQPDSALAYYNRSLQIDPDYGYASLQKANLYYSIGDSANYEREITSVLVNKNIETDTKVSILTDYIRNDIQRNDTTARVENMFRTILGQHPHEAQIRNLFSDYLSFRKKYEAAAEQLSYVVDIDPSDPKNWERLMWLYIYTDQPRKSIETGEKALHFNPGQFAVYQVLGIAYYQLKDYDKSIECYDTLLARNKEYQEIDESDIYTSLAENYHQKGDTAKAIECYETALSINPKNILALNNYAYYLCTGKPDDPKTMEWAEEMSKTAVTAEPENSSYLDTYAWIMFLKHDYRTALEYIEKAVEFRDMDQPNGELWEHYGDILFMLGRPDEAVENWKKALDAKPDSRLLKKKIDNKAYFYE